MNADPLLARLGRLDACAVSDALDGLGRTGALAGFHRFGPGRFVFGRAITVALEPGPATPGGSHLGTRALAMAGPDHVLVVANAGRTHAGAWGGLLSLVAHLRGVAGIVVDGALRDADEVEALDVPVFARSTTTRTARGRFHEVGTGVPVEVGGVRVLPGDFVVADGSGVVVVPAANAAEIVERAEHVAREEARIAAALRAGGEGGDVLGARYEGLPAGGAS